jgi:hypothetical protein
MSGQFPRDRLAAFPPRRQADCLSVSAQELFDLMLSIIAARYRGRDIQTAEHAEARCDKLTTPEAKIHP